MKKSFFTPLLLSLSIAISRSANAAMSIKANIDRVEVGEGMFSIYASGGDFGKESCDSGQVIIFNAADFPTSHGNMLSVALAAKATNREVTMWFSGCQSTPWGYTVPKANTIILYLSFCLLAT